MRALMASGKVRRTLNRDAVADQWMYGTVHAPATIVSGVHIVGTRRHARWFKTRN